ncbi:MAG: hypothetical protein II868_00280, partial [Butyrivibrio sp.]|nr:hypothetical protein [Butyrivibrio sp.]
MEENYYQMNGQTGAPQMNRQTGTPQGTTEPAAQGTETSTNTAQSYGAYQYSNERYVSDNYSYRNGGGGNYYNPYIQPQPGAQDTKKKKKKASPVAKAIGVMAATICVAAAALLIAFSFLRVTDPSRRPETDTPGSATSNVAANIEPTENVPEPEVIPDQDEPVSDTPPASGSGSTIISTIQSTDMSAVVTDVTQVVEGAMPSVVIIDNNYTARARTIYGVYEEDATDTGSGVI